MQKSIKRNSEQNRIFEISLLLLITIFAMAIRFLKLGEWSFWIDEIATINRALTPLGELLSRGQIGFTYVLTGIALKSFGVSEWSSRLVPALMGIITIPIIYFPIKAMFEAKTGLIAVLLIAISPWHLFWSQSARFYTPLMLFYFLAMFAFYYGFEKDRISYIFLGIIFTLIAFQERMFSLLLLPTLVIYLGLVKWSSFETPKGLNKRNLFPLVGVGFIGLLVAIFDAIRYASSGKSFILNELAWFFARPIDDPFRLGVFIVLSIGLAIVVLAVLSGGYLILERNRAGLFFSIGAIFPLVLIISLNPFMFTEPRYLFMTLPCWVILASAGVKEIFSLSHGHSKLLAWAVLLMLAATSLGSYLLYFTVNHGDRFDWRSSFEFVQDRSDVGDVIVSTRPQIGTYYFDGEIQHYREITPEVIEADQHRYWFVVDSEKIWDNRAMKEWLDNNALIANFSYLRVPEELNLRIYIYDPESPS
jgi:mannosyltransferase